MNPDICSASAFPLTKFRRDLYAGIERRQHHLAARRPNAEYDSLKPRLDQGLDLTLLGVHSKRRQQQRFERPPWRMLQRRARDAGYSDGGL